MAKENLHRRSVRLALKAEGYWAGRSGHAHFYLPGSEANWLRMLGYELGLQHYAQTLH